MDSISKPVVLLITAYNRHDKLERTLESLGPELHLLDIVLVDDGSTPPIRIDKFVHYPIHLIRLPENRGVTSASNVGLEYIYAKNYEYIARLDSDDVVINQRFTRQLAFLRAHQDIGLVGGQYTVVNPQGKFVFNSRLFLEDSQIRKAICISLMLFHPTLMMRTKVARENGFYNTSFIAAGDYEFCWRMVEITNVSNLPDFIIKYEMGAPDSISKSKRRIQAINGLKIKLHHFDAFNAYAYLGVFISLLDIIGVLKYTVMIRKTVMDTLFPE